MDPLTIIAVTIVIAVGVPMTSYLGYRVHKRLEWNKLNDPWYTTTTTMAPAATTTTTTTPAPLTKRPPKHRRRQGRKKIETRWTAIPVILTVTAAAHPAVEYYDRLTANHQRLRQCGWGLVLLPALIAAYMTVTVTANIP